MRIENGTQMTQIKQMNADFFLPYINKIRSAVIRVICVICVLKSPSSTNKLKN